MYLLSRGIHWTKFGNIQANGSKTNEWTSLALRTDRPTDQQVQNNMLSFFKGGGEHKIIYIFFSFPLLNDFYVKTKISISLSNTGSYIHLCDWLNLLLALIQSKLYNLKMYLKLYDNPGEIALHDLRKNALYK